MDHLLCFLVIVLAIHSQIYVRFQTHECTTELENSIEPRCMLQNDSGQLMSRADLSAG
jgi:hypothetical protein